MPACRDVSVDVAVTFERRIMEKVVDGKPCCCCTYAYCTSTHRSSLEQRCLYSTRFACHTVVYHCATEMQQRDGTAAMLVVNMDVVDRHEESAVAAPRVLQLCQMVSAVNADASLGLSTCNNVQWLRWQSVWRLWALSQKGNELSRGLSVMHDRLSTICTGCHCGGLPNVCPWPCLSYLNGHAHHAHRSSPEHHRSTNPRSSV